MSAPPDGGRRYRLVLFGWPDQDGGQEWGTITTYNGIWGALVEARHALRCFPEHAFCAVYREGEPTALINAWQGEKP